MQLFKLYKLLIFLGFTPPQSQVFTHNVKHDRMALKHFQAPEKFYPNASFCHSPADDSLTNITWLGQMGVNNLMPLPIECDKKYLEVILVFYTNRL